MQKKNQEIRTEKLDLKHNIFHPSIKMMMVYVCVFVPCVAWLDIYCNFRK